MIPADIISCVEFNHDGELLATGDKGGRVVIFHCEQPQSSKRGGHGAGTPGEYTVYSTFQVSGTETERGDTEHDHANQTPYS